MTHEELLAKINNLPEVIGLAEFKARHDALCAVVELHKPVITNYSSYCLHCETQPAAPCPTILAIQKEFC